MEIIYGSKVRDSEGKYLGTIDYIIHNPWSGEVSKFMIRRQSPEKGLFIRVQDVDKETETEVSLKRTEEELEAQTE